MGTPAIDVISPRHTRTLPGLFNERVRRSPQAPAYRYHDARTNVWRTISWLEMAEQVRRWRMAFYREGLTQGDRVAVMIPNSPEWVAFDQAALAQGLVVVPLFHDDRPDNACHILEDAGARLLLIYDAPQWQRMKEALKRLATLRRIVSVREVPGHATPTHLSEWLPGEAAETPPDPTIARHDLATIVYTSGTTGRAKGVMLSHWNILTNAYGALRHVPAEPAAQLLSFLPLSHMLERTAGYYVPLMSGACVAFARSLQQLPEDLAAIRPTLLITVPRLFEKSYTKIQENLQAKGPLSRRLFDLVVELGWQRFQYDRHRGPWHPAFLLLAPLRRLVARPVLARLGGRLELVVCGGAPIPEPVARTFIGLGLTILQGYGLTETAPVVTVNRRHDNDPASVGPPLLWTRVRLGADSELHVKGPGVMLGYWNQPDATAQIIGSDGWLRTGDRAAIRGNHVYITGRQKEILVLTNGEKVPPADVENAIALAPLFDQALVFGEGRPHLGAILVLNADAWPRVARSAGLDPGDPEVLERPAFREAVSEWLDHQLREFPGYARISRFILTLAPWTVEQGQLTPSMKLRRERIMADHASALEALYHEEGQPQREKAG